MQRLHCEKSVACKSGWLAVQASTRWLQRLAKLQAVATEPGAGGEPSRACGKRAEAIDGTEATRPSG